MKKITIMFALCCTMAFAQQKGTFTDSRDGKQYKTVKIGSQVWMAENLNYETSDSKCYDNDRLNCNRGHGRLYGKAAASNVCPNGWNLPTNADYDKLYRYIDGGRDRNVDPVINSKTAGKHLKAYSGWNSSNGKSGNGTDRYGFAALPSGGYSSGTFRSAGEMGSWWCSIENTTNFCVQLMMGNDMTFTDLTEMNGADYKGNESGMMSIRCIQGEEKSFNEESTTTRTVTENNSNTTLIDSRDGKRYRTTKIGDQVWMAENLNYNVNGSTCGASCERYGRFYNWRTAKNICPEGWHLPDRKEWVTLLTYIHKDNNCSECDGRYLRATRGWNNNGSGIDKYGFAALPGGGGTADDDGMAGNIGMWWSASEEDSQNAVALALSYDMRESTLITGHKTSVLINVRCLKNDGNEETLSLDEKKNSATTETSVNKDVCNAETKKAKNIYERCKRITDKQSEAYRQCAYELKKAKAKFDQICKNNH